MTGTVLPLEELGLALTPETLLMRALLVMVADGRALAHELHEPGMIAEL